MVSIQLADIEPKFKKIEKKGMEGLWSKQKIRESYSTGPAGPLCSQKINAVGAGQRACGPPTSATGT